MIWSKLQKQLYNIIDKSVDFQIHCAVYKTKSAWCAGQKSGVSKRKEQIPRYWVVVNGKIIWDYPNMFLDEISQDDYNTIRQSYFFYTNYVWVSNAIRQYINTPREKLLDLQIPEDKYGLINVLKKYDRRISKSKREVL